jgi:hypothetical protein
VISARDLVAGLAVLAIAAPEAAAQGHRPYVAVVAGINFAKWVGDDVGPGSERRTAFHGGGLVGLGLSPALSLQSGLVYSQEGTGADLGGGVSGSVKVDYLTVPLEFKAGTTLSGTTPIRPYLLAGARVGFKTRCKVEASGGSASAEVDCDDPGLQLQLKSTDFGLNFGAGVEIGRVTIGGRYTMGLTSIDDTGGSADVKNSVLAITGGFRF